jgi:hypothetical protein
MTVEVDPALSVDEKRNVSWAGPGDDVAIAPDRPLAAKLRQVTREAPLQSLAIAFLLGVLIARHRRR